MRVRMGGGSAILATPVLVNGNFPKGQGLKVLIKNSGEKVGSLLGGAELEKKVLSEGEEVLRE